jgi:hypothetical protein
MVGNNVANRRQYADFERAAGERLRPDRATMTSLTKEVFDG